MSQSQWILLCRLTYGIYCTGGAFSDRPVPVYQNSILELHFSTVTEFSTFHQRALSWTPSHLVDFSMTEISSNRVVGQVRANHTPEMTLMDPRDAFPDADPESVIIRIQHMN